MITKATFRFSTIHSKICILGGGSAGLNLSSKLLKIFEPSTIRIFEPAQLHYYQPAFTMIGGNLCQNSVAVRSMKDVLSKNIPLTAEAVKLVDPANNTILTQAGNTFTYQQLIVATGFRTDWQRIKGARQALDDPNCPVVSIYSYQYAQKTRLLGQQFKGGKAIFTEPQLPIKCAGAPQKILYLLSDKWRKNGIKADVKFTKDAAVMFSQPNFAEALGKVAAGYNIKVEYRRRLIEVKKNQKIAVYLNLATNQVQEEQFDFLHVTPPMLPHSYIKQSGISDEKGFVDVDKYTLRHKKYPNIWSIGDCSNLPTSKTAAAIFTQSQIFMKNFVQVVKKHQLPQNMYDGYTCCPIFVGGGKLMLAEFKYDGVLDPSFLSNQLVPRKIFYFLKKQVFPYAYWNFVPKGVWAGKEGLRSW